jgi:hypothetical protein
MGGIVTRPAHPRLTFPEGSIKSPCIFSWYDRYGHLYEIRVLLEPTGAVWYLVTTYYPDGTFYKMTKKAIYTVKLEDDEKHFHIILDSSYLYNGKEFNQRQYLNFWKDPSTQLIVCTTDGVVSKPFTEPFPITKNPTMYWIETFFIQKKKESEPVTTAAKVEIE